MTTLIFICTGNTCRSPMAEYLLKDMLRERGLSDWHVKSAGINTLNGSGANEKAVRALAEADIDINEHTARQVDSDLLREADLVLTMTASHARVLREMEPDFRHKIYTLKGFAGRGDNPDILDPFGQSINVYRETRDKIKAVLEDVLGKLTQSSLKEGKNKIIENNIIERKGSGNKVKIALGSDHAGHIYKDKIKNLLEERGIEFQDMGTNSDESVDYPDFAYKVASGVADGEFEKGILICGTGIGMSMAANKIEGIRAALCHDVFSAKATRHHNNANILTMGARVIGSDLALEIVKAWLDTDFDGGRHKRRINKIALIERGEYQEDE